MLIIKNTVETTATPEQIWRIYEDVQTWPIWDKGIEWIRLNGQLKKDTRGKLKPKGGPTVSFEIAESTPLKSFTNISYLPLTKIIFAHNLEQKENKVYITHQVEMKGILAPFFRLVIGRNIKKDLIPSMKQLVNLAEKKS